MNPKPPRSDEVSGPVLFFDGECGLCNRVVRTLLRWDRTGALHFAPLQGSTAQTYLRRHGLPTEDFDSLVLVPEWSQRDRPDYLVRTDGALEALRVSGRLPRTVAILKRIPPRWRDAMYKLVARVRYRLFGQWVPRPLENPDWQRRFLDGA